MTDSIVAVDIEDLRLAVYGRFCRGEIPRIADLATELSSTQEQVRSGLAILAGGRHVALGLPTLWRLASGWYTGRFERGYVRASRALLPTTCEVSDYPARFWAS